MPASRLRPNVRYAMPSASAAVIVGSFSMFGPRAAVAADSPAFPQRVTADIGWFGGYSHAKRSSRFIVGENSNHRSGYGELALDGAGFGQGLFINGTVRIIRRFAVGAEAWYYKHSFELHSPLADGLGIRFGRRDYLGLSVAIEYLPFATDYSPRHGWFIQGSAGPMAMYDHVRSAEYHLDGGSPNVVLQMMTSGGYRLAVDSHYSLSLAAFFRIEMGLAAGLRIAGGFQ